MLPGWWFEGRFRATGRFVHTTLTDPILNTNIKLWSVALLFITVAVVVVIVVDVYIYISEQLTNQHYISPIK